VAIGVIFCGSGVQLWVPQIVQAMGFSNETVGIVVALPFVCAAAAMIVWGYASDRREERIWRARRFGRASAPMMPQDVHTIPALNPSDYDP
jgi:hypothetical protein